MAQKSNLKAMIVGLSLCFVLIGVSLVMIYMHDIHKDQPSNLLDTGNDELYLPYD